MEYDNIISIFFLENDHTHHIILKKIEISNILESLYQKEIVIFVGQSLHLFVPSIHLLENDG